MHSIKRLCWYINMCILTHISPVHIDISLTSIILWINRQYIYSKSFTIIILQTTSVCMYCVIRMQFAINDPYYYYPICHSFSEFKLFKRDMSARGTCLSMQVRCHHRSWGGERSCTPHLFQMLVFYCIDPSPSNPLATHLHIRGAALVSMHTMYLIEIVSHEGFRQFAKVHFQGTLS